MENNSMLQEREDILSNHPVSHGQMSKLFGSPWQVQADTTPRPPIQEQIGQNKKIKCFWCNRKYVDLESHTKNIHIGLSARSYDLL